MAQQKRFGQHTSTKRPTYDPSDTTNDIMIDYMKKLQKVPQLPHDELVELFKVYEKGGQAATTAKKKIAEHNLRLVVNIVKQYPRSSIPIMDLIGEGNVGLYHAIEKFKHDKGFHFSTYASWWVKQAIGSYMSQAKRTVRMPSHAINVQRQLIKTTEKLKNDLGYEPSCQEVLDACNASQIVAHATMHSCRGTVSLQQPTCKAGYNNDETLEDRLLSEDNPERNVSEKQTLELIKNVMTSLSPKEEAVLRLRFGIDDVDEDKFLVDEDEFEKTLV